MVVASLVNATYANDAPFYVVVAHAYADEDDLSYARVVDFATTAALGGTFADVAVNL